MTAGWQVFHNATSLEMAIKGVTASASVISLLFTAYLVFRHLKHWTDPEGQKCIVRILFMVPIYSVVSWLAILLGDYALYFTLIRDCYEAYVLYQFFSLMVHYLEKEGPTYFSTPRSGLERANITPEPVGKLMSFFPETTFPFPLCRTTYQPSNRVFFHIKRCSLQYVFVKPLLSMIGIILQLAGLYHQGSFDYHYGYFWIAMGLNVSAALALYFIFLFYDLIKEVIHPYRPLLKLISIKILLFFVFWQGLAVAVLYYFHAFPSFFDWSTERSAETVQNVLICIEMTGLALFNLYAFSYVDYRTQPGENTLDVAMDSFKSVLNQSDIAEDTKDAFHPDRLKHAYEKHVQQM